MTGLVLWCIGLSAFGQLSADAGVGQPVGLRSLLTAVTAQTEAVTVARTGLQTAILAEPKNEANVRAKVEALREAELVLAMAQVDVFNQVQASPDKLLPEQIDAWVHPLAANVVPAGGTARGGAGARGGGGGGRGGQRGGAAVPGPAAPSPGEMADGFSSIARGRGAARAAAPVPAYLTDIQQTEVTRRLGEDLGEIHKELGQARTALLEAIYTSSANAPEQLKSKTDVLTKTELKLALAKANAFEKIQASGLRLTRQQVELLIAGGNANREWN